MDLFNNKKLLEKEEEISRLKLHTQQLENNLKKLKQELSDLISEVENLQNEKAKEAKLHREVIDTMLGEIQALIVDNNHKELSFRTLDILFPLVKDLIENHKFKLNLGLSLPYPFSDLKSEQKRKKILEVCNSITDEWEIIGLTEKTIVDDIIIKRDSFQYPYEGCMLKIVSKFGQDEFIYKIKTLALKKGSTASESYLYKATDINFGTENGNLFIIFYYGR